MAERRHWLLPWGVSAAAGAAAVFSVHVLRDQFLGGFVFGAGVMFADRIRK